MKEARIVITHGGTGTIINALRLGKKVIAIPRLKKYKEHVDDHQLELLTTFSEAGYILLASNMKDLESCIENVDDFHPKKYESSNKQMIDILSDYIKNL